MLEGLAQISWQGGIPSEIPRLTLRQIINLSDKGLDMKKQPSSKSFYGDLRKGNTLLPADGGLKINQGNAI